MLSLVLMGLLLLPCLLAGGSLALFWKSRRRAILRWGIFAYMALVLLFFLGAGPYLAAWSLAHAGSRPADQRMTENPHDFGIPHEDVAFDSRDGLRLNGWFVPPSDGRPLIIGTHGLFRNRHELLPRSIHLARIGYGFLLYDSRSHGSSQEGIVSLGYHERNDVIGAIQYVRRRYQDAQKQPQLVLLGVSMGASAVLEAAAEGGGYSALILDSPFASLRETAGDHLWHIFKLPRFPFAPLFLFWFRYATGVDADRLDARKSLKKITPVPLLIIASEGDQRMGAGVARSLYGEAPFPVKKLHLFGKDVPHGASARLHPEEYTRLVNDFLEGELQQTAGPAATSPSGKEGSLQ